MSEQWHYNIIETSYFPFIFADAYERQVPKLKKSLAACELTNHDGD